MARRRSRRFDDSARYAADRFGWHGWYGSRLSVAARQAQAARRAAALQKKSRRTFAPIVVEGRNIATTFWGEAWCANLERYSDFANRLPRGRSYVRNGSVIDLAIEPGRVTALVSGTNLYTVQVDVAAVPKARWAAICRDSAGAIDSVVELLQGRLSASVMARLCREGTGLFPAPKEIRFACSCPDWAAMCKHVAAVLYGIGVRLDREPSLLFTLRQVKADELIGRASGAGLARKGSGAGGRKVLDGASLGAIFGLDLVETPNAAGAQSPSRPMRRTRKRSAPRR
jgi:hypothetical protein